MNKHSYSNVQAELLKHFRSEAVMLDLDLLDQYIDGVGRAGDELKAVCGCGDVGRAISPVRDLRQLFDRQAEVIVRLTQSVTPFDQEIAGSKVGSVRELMLRARMLVVETQLLRLTETLGCVATSATRYPALFIGRCRDICDLAVLTRDLLHEANSPWLRHRRDHGVVPPSGPEPLRSAYLAAVQSALSNVRRLRELPELVHFVRRGAGLACRDVVSACELIAAALEIPLAVDTVGAGRASGRGEQLRLQATA